MPKWIHKKNLKKKLKASPHALPKDKAARIRKRLMATHPFEGQVLGR